MGIIIDLRAHRMKSLHYAIRDLYATMEKHGEENKRDPMTKLSNEEVTKRALFYRKMCGEFAKRFRTNRFLTPLNVAECVNWPQEKYLSFEEGEIPFSDEEFVTICRFLGAQNELSIFIENMEESFNHGLKQTRTKNASFLASLGIKFADPAKYRSNDEAVVIHYKKNNEDHE